MISGNWANHGARSFAHGWGEVDEELITVQVCQRFLNTYYVSVLEHTKKPRIAGNEWNRCDEEDFYFNAPLLTREEVRCRQRRYKRLWGLNWHCPCSCMRFERKHCHRIDHKHLPLVELSQRCQDANLYSLKDIKECKNKSVMNKSDHIIVFFSI